MNKLVLVVEESARRVVAQHEPVDPAVVAVRLVARDAFDRRPLHLLRAADREGGAFGARRMGREERGQARPADDITL